MFYSDYFENRYICVCFFISRNFANKINHKRKQEEGSDSGQNHSTGIRNRTKNTEKIKEEKNEL